ncbi:glycosyltransferase [Deinococcus budaensis]|uniref:GT2 family glycosyltransferase n=1 Tax=Deinococcus budaensis TaxID=1665626 RepID=A0A7W8GDL2_9DEIO|nr:glycosyltransferase [Deinococcus budaensis]MBB5233667.1 GT2 family glycosyltransferase [Deinococcus budaensis]
MSDVFPLPPYPAQAPARRPLEGVGTAAVVVTYNRKALLVKCLRSLLNQTAPLARIYVIDNASTDGTPEVIPADERVTYLRLDRNLGGAYGFAYGVRKVLEGDFRHVWLMDDDCFAEDDAHEQLLKWEGTAEALCTAVLARDGTYDLGHRRSFNMITLADTALGPEIYAQACTPIDMFTFVGVLIPLEVVRQVGVPVDNFFFMGDDTEYALRLKSHGLRTHLIPASRIWHHGSVPGHAPRGKFEPKRHYYNIRNSLLIRRRYATSPLWLALSFAAYALRGYGGLARHGELTWRSAALTTEALRDALLGRAYVKDFGPG